MQRKTIQYTKNFFYVIALTVVSLFCIFPFLWMLTLSLKTRAQSYDPSILFFLPTSENYRAIFSDSSIVSLIVNSVIVSVCTSIISLILGGMTAYGLSRYRFKHNSDLSFWILSLRMIPAMAAVIPFFIIASTVKLFDSQILLIICYTLFNIPFVVWMMKSFLDDIPAEVEEAASIDGCGLFQRIYKIVLPLAVPGLIATLIFCIIQSWNEFTFALFLTSKNAATLPTSVQRFLSVTGVMWGQMSAVGVVSTAPIIFFAILVQKHMIRGLTFGAVKG